MEMNEKVKKVPEHPIRTKLFVVATTMVLLGAVLTAVTLGMFGGLPVRAIVAADGVLPIQNITLVSPALNGNATAGILGNSTGWAHSEWYTENVTLNLTAVDPVLNATTLNHQKINLTQYRVNGGAWVNYTNATIHLKNITLNQSVTTEGGNVTVEARSMCNNDTSAIARITVWIDTKAPVVTWALVTGTAGTNGWYTSPTVKVKLVATDTNGSGVNTTYYKNGTGAVKSVLFNKTGGASRMPTFIMSGEGTKINITACAKDNTTVNNGTMTAIPVKIDSVAPAFTLTNASGSISGNKTTLNTTLNWTAMSDATSGPGHYEVKVGTGAFAPIGNVLKVKLTGLVKGNNTVTVKAVDLAGNNKTATVYIWTDKTAPVVSSTVTGTLGLNGWYTSATVTVKLVATDTGGSGVNTTYYKNGTGAVKSVLFNKTMPTFLMSGEGTHNLTACAKDNASNNGTMKDFGVKIDSVAPTLTLTNASTSTPPVYSGNKTTLVWTGSDATSGIDHYEVKVGTGAFVSVGNVLSYQLTGLAVGNNTVTVKAVDKAGLSVDRVIYLTVSAGSDMTLILIILAIIVVIVIAVVMMMKRKGKSPVDVAAPEAEEIKPSN